MIDSVQHSTRPYDKFVAKKASEYVYTTSFLATQEFMRPNSTPHFGLPIDGPRITSSFVTKRLVAGGFEAHKVAVKRLNMHMTADSLDGLVDNLMVAKVVLVPDYADEELKVFVPILKREVAQVGGVQGFW
jgi:hypothetical protein